MPVSACRRCEIGAEQFSHGLLLRGGFDEVLATYRVLDESASHSPDPDRQKAFLDSAHRVRRHFAERYASGSASAEIDRGHESARLCLAYHLGDRELAQQAWGALVALPGRPSWKERGWRFGAVSSLRPLIRGVVGARDAWRAREP